MKYFCILILLVSFLNAYDYKKVGDFKTSQQAGSWSSFLNDFKTYKKECVANTYGGSQGIGCFIESQLWDRELNIIYKKLYKSLSSEEQKLLKSSQLSWIQTRDKTFEFQSKLFDKKYPGMGTMYSLMRAAKADELSSFFIKSRVMLLEKWLLLKDLN